MAETKEDIPAIRTRRLGEIAAGGQASLRRLQGLLDERVDGRAQRFRQGSERAERAKRGLPAEMKGAASALAQADVEEEVEQQGQRLGAEARKCLPSLEACAEWEKPLQELRGERRIEPLARDRIRSMWDERRMAPDAIFEEAVRRRDPDLLAALGVEVEDRARQVIPGQSRPDENAIRLSGELELAADRALSEITGDRALKSVLQMRGLAETIPQARRLAETLADGGTDSLLQARLAMAHVQPEGDV